MTADINLQFVEIIDKISEAESTDQLTKIAFDICPAYGLANVVYHAMYVPGSASFNPVVIPTYVSEWVDRYIHNDYFKIDPIVAFGKNGFLPLDWSEIDKDTNKARDFFKEADRYEVGRQGVSLPIRGPGGEQALFTVTSNFSETEWQKCRFTYMREFQIISHYFHDRVVEVLGYRTAVKSPSLSRREMECLQLTADGLVPKRVASRLTISDSAVRLYLRSACRKLGCASVHQAIAKMVTLELLHPRL